MFPAPGPEETREQGRDSLEQDWKWRGIKQGKKDKGNHRIFVNDEVGGKNKLRQRVCTSQEAGRSTNKSKKKKKVLWQSRVGKSKGVRGSRTLKDGKSDRKEKIYTILSKQKLREGNSKVKSLGQNQVEIQ